MHEGLTAISSARLGYMASPMPAGTTEAPIDSSLDFESCGRQCVTIYCETQERSSQPPTPQARIDLGAHYSDLVPRLGTLIYLET